MDKQLELPDYDPFFDEDYQSVCGNPDVPKREFCEADQQNCTGCPFCVEEEPASIRNTKSATSEFREVSKQTCLSRPPTNRAHIATCGFTWTEKLSAPGTGII